jgi:hypothetical protein
MLKKLKDESLNDAASSLIFSDFFPRVDKLTRDENEMRSRLDPAPPPFELSKL